MGKRAGKRSSMVREADLVFTFRQAVKTLPMLSPKRLETLRVLRQTGPQTMYALAKRMKRSYSVVFTDVGKMRKLGLIEKNEKGLVLVPYEAVEIRFPIGDPQKEKK